MTGRAGRPGIPRSPRPAPGAGWPDEQDQFDEWRERVRNTYRAVRFTCGHRLSDPSLAEPVAVGVVTGLLARPTVFRYFGLPFSGRIATLAEDLLARAEAGHPIPTGAAWPELESRLDELPAEHRTVLVATCVRGESGPRLAESLGCDEPTAATRRTATLTYMCDVVAAGAGPSGPRQEG